MGARLAAITVLLAACASTPEPTLVAIGPGEICSEVITVPEMSDRSHVEVGSALEYDTEPPTSGPHYATTAPTGVHRRPIADGYLVHNLEHGHIMIQYRDLPVTDLRALERVVREDPVMIVLASRPAMPWKLALTAWTKIQVCSEFPDDSETMIESFVEEHRDSGVAPESIP